MPKTHSSKYYEKFNIKEYKFWMLKVHEYQTYLGQVVIWLKRPGEMQRLSVLNEEERAELWGTILPEYERVLGELWNPDHLNYSWLGNFLGIHGGHGHFHVVPRYRSPRTFGEREFVDAHWGAHYARESDKTIPIEIALKVRDAFKEKLV